MQTSILGRTNLSVSRLGLGTAEIGFAYGIGARELPSETEAINLLQRAVDLGITFFDTANYYGLSEERLGRSGILRDERIIVETKCAQFLEKGEYFSRAELETKIRDQVTDSLTKLSVEALPILMLHGPSAEQIEQGDLIDILGALKQEGKVRFTGTSIRGEEPALATITSDFFDVIQVAYSILDQRMQSQVLSLASQQNIGVVNRSVLLKGSLTPLRAQLPIGLEQLQSHAEQANVIASEQGMDLPTLAIRFAISHPTIATSLIGTNKLSNLERSIAAVEAGPLPADVISALEKLAITDISQVDPAKWPPLNP